MPLKPVAIALLLLALAVTSCSTCRHGRGRVDLFNGKDLEGWNYICAEPQVALEKVWSVRDGVLTCQGTPVGAIYRGPAVTNFRLLVEYRWQPGSEPGNSGIFTRIQGEMKPLPPAIETQLKHGSAGDVLGLQGRSIAAGQPRFFEVKKHPLAGDIAGVNKLSDQEKPAGEWNRVEILAKGGRYKVWVNGKLVNEVEGVDTAGGMVGLQSEGGVIQFRRVLLESTD